MNDKADLSPPENRFRGRLVRKALWVIIPTFLLPVISAFIGGQLFPRLYPTGEVFALILILFICGLIISILFDWFLTRQIIQPLQQITETVSYISRGDFQKQADEKRKDEIGLLAYSVNQIGKNLSDHYNNLENQVRNGTEFIQTAAEIGEKALSIQDIDEILQTTVSLIVENFFHFHAAIFIIDKKKSKAVLRAIHGRASTNPDCNDYRVPIDSESIIGWTAKYNQTRIVIDINRDPLYKAFPGLPDTKSEIAIPISTYGQVLGVLGVQDAAYDAFGEEEITTLQLIANQLAAAIQIRFPTGIDSIDPETTLHLYKASHTISTAQTAEDVFDNLKSALLQLPYAAALFTAEGNLFYNLLITNPMGHIIQNESLLKLTLPSTAIMEGIPATTPVLLADPAQMALMPDPLIEVCQNLNYKFLIMFPILVNQKLSGLLFMGATRQEVLSYNDLELLTNLVEITTTSLEKVNALQAIAERITELQTLKSVSQSISTEADLNTLYDIIHYQVVQLMGKVNFLIALYDENNGTIEIPYMEEDDEIVAVPPFPLGEGLTSIIIRTRKPLLIVEDTINRGRELGAIVTGDKPALSWLGVPMILQGDIIGAIVVQDLEKEYRFDEDDMRLLTTLAAQVAIAINSTRLIEISEVRAARDQHLFDITNKIRHAVNIQDVVETTAEELSKALNIRKAQINITLEPESQKPIDRNQMKDFE